MSLLRKFRRQNAPTFWQTGVNSSGDVVLQIEKPKGKPLAHITFDAADQIDPLIESLMQLRVNKWGEPKE